MNKVAASDALSADAHLAALVYELSERLRELGDLEASSLPCDEDECPRMIEKLLARRATAARTGGTGRGVRGGARMHGGQRERVVGRYPRPAAGVKWRGDGSW